MTLSTGKPTRRELLLAAMTLPATALSLARTAEESVWTPDQQHRFFRAPGGIYWADHRGSSGLFVPLGLSHALLPGGVSPDSRHLVYTALNRQTFATLGIAPILWQHGRPVAGTPFAFTHGETVDAAARFSADGAQITWASLKAGRWSLRQRRFSG